MPVINDRRRGNKRSFMRRDRRVTAFRINSILLFKTVSE